MSYHKTRRGLGIIITGYGQVPSMGPLGPGLTLTESSGDTLAQPSGTPTQEGAAMSQLYEQQAAAAPLPDMDYPVDLQEELELQARRRELEALAIERDLLAPSSVEPEVLARENINQMTQAIVQDQQASAVVNAEGEPMFPSEPTGREDYFGPSPQEIAEREADLLAAERVQQHAMMTAAAAAAAAPTPGKVIDVPFKQISSTPVPAPAETPAAAPAKAAKATSSSGGGGSAVSTAATAPASATSLYAPTKPASTPATGSGTSLLVLGGLALGAWLLLRK